MRNPTTIIIFSVLIMFFAIMVGCGTQQKEETKGWQIIEKYDDFNETLTQACVLNGDIQNFDNEKGFLSMQKISKNGKIIETAFKFGVYKSNSKISILTVASTSDIGCNDHSDNWCTNNLNETSLKFKFNTDSEIIKVPFKGILDTKKDNLFLIMRNYGNTNIDYYDLIINKLNNNQSLTVEFDAGVYEINRIKFDNIQNYKDVCKFKYENN